MCNTWEKRLVMYIGSAIDIGFFLNNEYRMEKCDIGTPLASCAILAAATHMLYDHAYI